MHNKIDSSGWLFEIEEAVEHISLGKGIIVERHYNNPVGHVYRIKFNDVAIQASKGFVCHAECAIKKSEQLTLDKA